MQHIIKKVEPRSPGARAGAMPGDELIAVNGHKIEDVLDYKFHGASRKVTLTVKRGEDTLQLRMLKHSSEDIGLEFENYLMDKSRACCNRCVFCFVDQLPRGMRSTLYFKDDDSRLSFLLGNYITLTNLTDREIQRIIDLKISPINISVHATDAELRKLMLGCNKDGRGFDLMQRLAAAGITMNCQIVVCPGLNDGAQLEKSLRDLYSLWPMVPSVSVVPVGLTKFRENLYPLTPFDREAARKTIAQVDALGVEFMKECGSRVVFCADELYLKAGLDIPDEEYYEDYPQIENGVGLMRSLETEFFAAPDEKGDAEISLVTGVSAAPFMKRLADAVNKNCTVYPIVNEFFGETIDVAGLVTGGDIIKQLRGKPVGEKILIPLVMLRSGERVFLDNVTVEEIERELGAPVEIIENDGAALKSALAARKGGHLG
ncbi:MAG: DUF512 domain-containing protein [Oscillospiraceae bacterium]|nr:DUF512 domain-containing protein [Oscillospiraceae bacterium]